MIGMPRMRLIRPALIALATRKPETRIKAQTMPRMVESTSEPSVTTTVRPTPCRRIGKNSVASDKNFCIGQAERSKLSPALGAEAPFVEDFCKRAVRLQLGERGVDLAQQLLIALAYADRDGADGHRLVGFDQAHLRKQAQPEIVRKDRIVAISRLQAAGVHVAQDVGKGIVGLHLGEDAGLSERVDVSRADLRADHLALEVFRAGVVFRNALWHHQSFAVGVDR